MNVIDTLDNLLEEMLADRSCEAAKTLYVIKQLTIRDHLVCNVCYSLTSLIDLHELRCLLTYLKRFYDVTMI